MVLLYSNKSKDDILCEVELSGFEKLNPDRLRLFHTLTRHNVEKHGEWKGHTGRISAELLKQCRFPEPSPETLITYCGPKGMNDTVEATLKALGYTADMMHKF